METQAHNPNRKERRPNNGFIRMPLWISRLVICLGQVVIAIIVLCGHVSADTAGPGSAANVVSGDVLNIEGEMYTIKDITGHEVSLRVNGQTKHEDRIKVGDKVQAQVGSDGVAQSIRVQLPDDPSASKLR